MALLVDTYNVLHMTGVLPPDLAGLGVLELRDLILTSRFRHMPVVLVCDGHGPGVRGADEASTAVDLGVAIHYTGSRRDADTHIERAIRACTDPHRLNVVSSDRRIARAARRRRCRVMGSDVFLETLESDWRRCAGKRSAAPTHAYTIPLDQGSVEWWRAYFGFDPRMAEDEPHVAAAPRMSRSSEKQRARPEAKTQAGDRAHRVQTRVDADHASDEIDVDSLDTGEFL